MAGGIAWEQIAEQVPGFVEAPDTCAAEKLFDLVSVDSSRHGQCHVSWRCHDCERFVSTTARKAAIRSMSGQPTGQL